MDITPQHEPEVRHAATLKVLKHYLDELDARFADGRFDVDDWCSTLSDIGDTLCDLSMSNVIADPRRRVLVSYAAGCAMNAVTLLALAESHPNDALKVLRKWYGKREIERCIADNPDLAEAMSEGA